MSKQIQAETLRTEYCQDPHLVITIDGVPLDQLLVDATENDQFRGLIPAWLDDLDSAADRKVVWDRLAAPVGSNANIPVLMCPDDLDFWCTVVIADTTFFHDSVHWHALGLDASGSDGLPDSIGSVVNWLAGVGPFHFPRADFDACVTKFKLNLEASGR